MIKYYLLAPLFYSLFLSSVLYAQSDIIQIKKDYIINAEASNLFPNINEPVNIKVRFKSPMDAEQGSFSLYFSLDDGLEYVSGNSSYSGNIKKDQVIDLDTQIRFTQRKVYSVDFRFNFFPNKKRLVTFTFYVDGAFRESKEVSGLRHDIARQKETMEKAHSLKGISLANFSGQSFSAPVNGYHTIITENEYENNNLTILQLKNEALYIILKKEFDSLHAENNKLFLQSKRSDKGQLKKDSSKDIFKAGWQNK